MGQFNTIEEAREYFAGDKFAMVNGITIDELSEECCVCSMDIREDHRNAMGGVMGGVMFTLADFAQAVLSNHIHKYTTALDVSINFLSQPKGSRLIAKALCVKSGRTTSVFNISISDDTGRAVALAVGTGYKL